MFGVIIIIFTFIGLCGNFLMQMTVPWVDIKHTDQPPDIFLNLPQGVYQLVERLK